MWLNEDPRLWTLNSIRQLYRDYMSLWNSTDIWPSRLPSGTTIKGRKKEQFLVPFWHIIDSHNSKKERHPSRHHVRSLRISQFMRSYADHHGDEIGLVRSEWYGASHRSATANTFVLFFLFRYMPRGPYMSYILRNYDMKVFRMDIGEWRWCSQAWQHPPLSPLLFPFAGLPIFNPPAWWRATWKMQM